MSAEDAIRRASSQIEGISRDAFTRVVLSMELSVKFGDPLVGRDDAANDVGCLVGGIGQEAARGLAAQCRQLFAECREKRSGCVSEH